MRRAILTLSTVIVFTSLLQADYYDSGWIEWKQPNGVTFTARWWGDEFYYYMETQDGYRIVQGNDDYYYYATLDESGEFAPSTNKVGIDNPLSSSYKLERSASRHAEIEQNRTTFLENLSLADDWYSAKRAQGDSTITLGVVLVDFTPSARYRDEDPIGDYHNGYYKDLFDSLLFSTDYWFELEPDGVDDIHPEGHRLFGSFRYYYHQQSLNKLDIIGAGVDGRSIVNPDSAGTGLPLWVILPNEKDWYAVSSARFDTVVWDAAESQLGVDLDQFDKVAFVVAGDPQCRDSGPVLMPEGILPQKGDTTVSRTLEPTVMSLGIY